MADEEKKDVPPTEKPKEEQAPPEGEKKMEGEKPPAEGEKPKEGEQPPGAPGKEGEKPPEGTPPAAPGEEKPAEETFDAKASYEKFMAGLEQTNARVSRLEEVLDKVAEQEELKGHRKDSIGETQQAAQTPPVPPDKKEEKPVAAGEAKNEKDEKPKDEEKEKEPKKEEGKFAKDELGEMKAQFAKQAERMAGLEAKIAQFENAGIRHTNPSSTPVEPDPDAEVRNTVKIVLKDLGVSS